MKSTLVARHGDVFIFKVNEEMDISKDKFKAQKSEILAYGEVTGHCHKLETKKEGDLLVANGVLNDGIAFELKAEGTLTHQEHDTITLEPGKYISIIQEEYDPVEETRKVMD